MAMSRCGQLRFVLDANNIKMSTKLKIYRCAVGSLFTYMATKHGACMKLT